MCPVGTEMLLSARPQHCVMLQKSNITQQQANMQSSVVFSLPHFLHQPKIIHYVGLSGLFSSKQASCLLYLSLSFSLNPLYQQQFWVILATCLVDCFTVQSVFLIRILRNSLFQDGLYRSLFKGYRSNHFVGKTLFPFFNNYSHASLICNLTFCISVSYSQL